MTLIFKKRILSKTLLSKTLLNSKLLNSTLFSSKVWLTFITLAFILSTSGCAIPVVEGVKSVMAKQNIEEFTVAATSGDAEAQYQLGNNFCCGNGYLFDTYQALYWHCKAAVQGHKLAQLELANIYAGKIGIMNRFKSQGMAYQDLVLAYTWYTEAINQGMEEAVAVRESIQAELTPAQQQQALLKSSSLLKTRCELKGAQSPAA